MSEQRYKIGPDDIDTYPKALRYLIGSILRIWLGLLVFDSFTKFVIMSENLIHHSDNAELSRLVFEVFCVGSGFLAIGFTISFLVFKAPKYAFGYVCFCDDGIVVKKIVGSSIKIVDSLKYSGVVDIISVKGSFTDAPDQLYKKGALLVVLRYKRGSGASMLRGLSIGPKSDVQIDEITKLIQAKNPRAVRRSL